MIGSLYTGISGLNTNAMAMSIIGDNIANVNTTAFKGSRATFANILNQSLPGLSGNEIGRGVVLAGQSPAWNQGSLKNTEKGSDLAINGKGFFIVDNSGRELYTRDGEFNFNKDGELVNGDGMIVQGWDLQSGIGIGGTTTDIVVPGGGSIQAQATSQFVVDLNLDAAAATNDTFASQFTIWDSLGNAIPLSITFTKTAVLNQWDWQASIPAALGAVGGGGSGTLTFNPDGTLAAGADPNITLALTTGGTTPQSVTWDLYTAGGVTNGNVTQYATPSATAFVNIDGGAAGTLRSVNIDEDGVISGTYSNGLTIALFQIALADFPDYSGLLKMGGNLYASSVNSGQVLRGAASQGSLGSISARSLELSNVDLASEFVNLITTQRAFQANSRVITTSDEILTELINIRR